jgi:cytidine deaminase
MDWSPLLEAARAAAAHAYRPYSHYAVGAAALTADGRIVAGCNVENASLGLTLCAECGLVSALHLGGGGRLAYFTCVNGPGDIITPCGRCRQLLLEHGGRDLVLLTPEGERTLDQMLPQSFGADTMAAGQDA